MLPSNISTGKVVGQFLVGVLDGPDADTDQDYVAAVGTVTLTPSIQYSPNLTADPNPVTMLLPPVTAVLDSEGYLSTPEQGTLTPAYRGVWLTATDDPDLSVTGWTWKADYNLSPVNGSPLGLPSHSFVIPAGGTLDLSTVVSVPSSPGLGTEQAEALTASAQAAAVASAASAEAAAQTLATSGVAVGGSALQILRKNAGNTAAEWATPDKTLVGLPNVDNTADTAKPVSSAQQAALDLKAPLASPAFTGTPTGITKTHVGLGNVDNTSDASKPVSTAQQAALDLKAPLASPAFTGTPTGITKTHVGLSNVDNTADVNKPVATGSVNGLMPAADKAAITAATNAATPSTLVKRDANGDVAHRRATVSDAPANANEVTRKDYVDGTATRYSPAGALSTTMDRRNVAASTIPALVSGTMRLTAVWLPKGATVTSITYLSGAVPTALTNRWFALLDGSRNMLRVTADDAGAWTAGATRTLNLSSTYAVPADGLYYIGFCEVATTLTTLRGVTSSSNAAAIAPILNGDGNSGLTNAASTPATSSAIIAQGGIPFAYVS